MKEIRAYSEEKTSSGMHTVFIQATFFKSSNLTLRLLKEIIRFSLRIIAKLPFNRIMTLLPGHCSLPGGEGIAAAHPPQHSVQGPVPWGARGLSPLWSGSLAHSSQPVLSQRKTWGVRRLRDPGRALRHLLHSSRRRGMCGKRQEKDQSLIKRSARLSRPYALPGWWNGLLYIITCQKYKCNISAWMWQLQPEREKHRSDAARLRGAPGCSAWVILALFSAHILFQSTRQLVFLFILSRIGRMEL